MQLTLLGGWSGGRGRGGGGGEKGEEEGHEWHRTDSRMFKQRSTLNIKLLNFISTSIELSYKFDY